MYVPLALLVKLCQLSDAWAESAHHLDISITAVLSSLMATCVSKLGIWLHLPTSSRSQPVSLSLAFCPLGLARPLKATDVLRLNGANFLSLARGKAVILLEYGWMSLLSCVFDASVHWS